MNEELEQPETPKQEDSEKEFDKKANNTNIALSLSEEELKEIGTKCKQGFDTDLASRSRWEENIDEWTKLAMQVRENKDYPWPNSSNIKYPLLSTAAMQFSARAYPSLIPSDGKIVKGKVIGKDPQGVKVDKADRIGTYMSYQLMHELCGWDEDMDRMLMILPIVGTIFKKTYWDASSKQIKSKLILPKNLVVNNWATSIEEAERASEIIEMTKRIYEERVRQKTFIDAELGEPVPFPKKDDGDSISTVDATTPYNFIEQHTFSKIGKDTFEKPYIITFERVSGKVVRITPRYESEDITLDEKQNPISIEPTQYYTKFSFIPNPDGSFYDIGFGILLGPINESVNTLVNQLVDAGTLNTLQSGFIGKGLRIRGGQNNLKPGEWMPVPSTGDDLRKQIVPLPAKEPSAVLLNLMQLLITSGKELASVAEIFVGKMPGQNTPATTTMASIEQGMKVFTAVYKRVYRSLDKEFKKLYKLNGLYLNPNTYVSVLDIPVGPDDFDEEMYDVCPGADPTAVSQTEKLLKAQGLMELLPTGALNPIEVISRVLQAQEQPNWERLFSQEVQQTGQIPQQPDPKMLELQAKSQMDQNKFQMEQQKNAFSQAMDQRDQQFKQVMSVQQQANDERHAQVMTAINAASTFHMDQARVQGARAKAQQGAQEHVQKLVQNAQTHSQKLQQMKEQKSVQKSPQTTSKSGKSTK